MYSNADFAALVRNGESSLTGKSKGEGEKTRFDLRQVKQWDNENKQAFDSRQRYGSGGGKPFKHRGQGYRSGEDERDEDELRTKEAGTKAKTTRGYRDRALERRTEEARQQKQQQQQQSESQSQLGAPLSLTTGSTQEAEVMASLSVAQTQYLGGDEEHTHLVKGLDMALLAKARQAAALTMPSDSSPNVIRLSKQKKKDATRSPDKNIFAESDQSENDQFDSSNEEDIGNEQDKAEFRMTPIHTKSKLGAALTSLLFRDESSARRFTMKHVTSEIDFGEVYDEVNRVVVQQQEQHDVNVGEVMSLRQSEIQRYQSAGPSAASRTAQVQVGVEARERLLTRTLSKAGEQLSRTGIQFQMQSKKVTGEESHEVEEEDAIPLLIMKGRKSAYGNDDSAHFALSPLLLSRIQGLFVNGQMVSTGNAKGLAGGVPGRPLTAKESLSKPCIPPLPAPVPAPVKQESIYDDDDDDEIDQDTPADAVAPDNAAGTSVVSRSSSKSLKALNTIVLFSVDGSEGKKPLKEDRSPPALKGLFQSVRHADMRSMASAATTTNKVPAKTLSTYETLAPVRGLLIAEATREQLELQRSQQRKQQQQQQLQQQQQRDLAAQEVVHETLIHRDVFATTMSKVVEANRNMQQPLGNVFGTAGQYDVFPDGQGYDIYSDDDDDNGAASQRPRKMMRNE